MSQISITGASTGTATFTIESPATSTNRTLTLPDNTGTIITQNSTPAFASTIGVGGATAAASGAGITFPATQSASSNANTLDDYEEGTWTPTASSQAGSLTSYASAGQYTKIGRTVFITGYVTITGAGTASSYMNIGSLPFTSLDFPNGRPAIVPTRENVATGVVYSGWLNANQTTMSISSLDFTSGIVWTNGHSYAFSATYQAA
jgi:hypothetical protein